ncbi:hypothetical protein IQ247_14945 [Plectonema cf. radiosum LEGE 06105]|uniref:DUF2281 domain-containing protein n=1 Tax=Plectonema cf. radiosum LEGE 06105 TaxID=945769 RepID=A0A8J7F2X3_9CYAN|nr:hypothetical protein [Plectonema radiosum]MBE9213947.1 hypothetical protein [Plectonema cf. radiosum LEGE 06105]
MTIKQEVFEAIEQLPEQQLEDVLQYIKQLASIQTTVTKPLTPVNDPLADFIGVVSHGSLATNLDNELYGD